MFPDLSHKVSLLEGSSSTDAMGETAGVATQSPHPISKTVYETKENNMFYNDLFAQIIQLHFRSKSDCFLGA